jgi:hypothetical protein
VGKKRGKSENGGEEQNMRMEGEAERRGDVK